MIARSRALAAVALTGVATFAAATPTWFSAPVARVVGESVVSVSGTGASPLIGALLLVIAAGLVAYLLARGPLARIVAGLVALAGAGLVAATLTALRDPAVPLRRLAAEVSGVPRLAGDIATTPWGWVGVAASVLLLLATIALVLAPVPAPSSSRFDRGRTGAASATSATPANLETDTAGTAGAGEFGTSAAPLDPVPSPASQEAAPEDDVAARTAALDDWDALTRGEDPSR